MRRLRRSAVWGIGVWAALIVGAFVVGEVMRRAGAATEDALPPLHAKARLLTWQMALAVGYAAVAVAVLPGVVRAIRWRLLLVVSWGMAVGWAVALSVSDGPKALARPLDAPTEYPAGLAAVGDHPLRWLRTFTAELHAYPTHVRGHPPLPTLVFWALDAVGLHGTLWPALLIIGVGASAAVAIALTVRIVAGEQIARRALPFLVLSPLSLWIATSMDAFFLGVGAWGVAFLAMRRPLIGGVLLGALPFLSYGLLPLLALPSAVLWITRPPARFWILMTLGLAVIPTALTLGGFWWPDGVRATLDTYLVSGGSARRSYPYFLVADVAVLGILTGPAVASVLPLLLKRGIAARRKVREEPVFLLAAAALIAVLSLDVAGVTKGEVERIWLPFAAWLLPAASDLRPPARGWLAAQAISALLVQALVLSEW
ncbi:hypothetical protein DZF91_02075 [Actinomadura logoneensis]|uniref:DUF2029 domain-containing protein n=1 Tax=Actinomadura logoneensis TaxID=2293572 RepID=A0A372JTB8_9ACTN|nr:hypothetical protein [Actinomadura logoneensis]RFU43257.1 hypothetical protein DZF91_02075 [Actinomadura logoneensis]